MRLNAISYPSVRLSIRLTTVCFVAVRLCLSDRLSVSQSVDLSVPSRQSNAPVTLTVISFPATLSLLGLRFRRRINNHIVKSKQNIIMPVTCQDSKRGYILII